MGASSSGALSAGFAVSPARSASRSACDIGASSSNALGAGFTASPARSASRSAWDMAASSSNRLSSKCGSSKFVSDATVPPLNGAAETESFARCSAAANISSNMVWVRGGSSANQLVSLSCSVGERSATGWATSDFVACGSPSRSASPRSGAWGGSEAAAVGVASRGAVWAWNFSSTSSSFVAAAPRFGTSVAFSSKALISTKGASSNRSDADPACAASRIRRSSGSSEDLLSDESLMAENADS